MQPLLDRGFRGQIFVAQGNAIFSRHSGQILVSGSTESPGQPLQRAVAKRIWGKDFHFYRYKEDFDRIEGHDARNYDPKHRQFDDSYVHPGNNFLVDTLERLIFGGHKAVLDAHFFNGDLTSLAPLKAHMSGIRGGSRFHIVVHLHCMPDQYAFQPCEYATQYTLGHISSDVTRNAEKRVRQNS